MALLYQDDAIFPSTCLTARHTYPVDCLVRREAHACVAPFKKNATVPPMSENMSDPQFKALFQTFEDASEPAQSAGRVAALRAALKRQQLDGLVVPRADRQQNEYRCRPNGVGF